MSWPRTRGIMITPQMEGAEPCLAGTRVSVLEVLEFLEDCPDALQALHTLKLTDGQLRALFRFVAKVLRERWRQELEQP